MTIAGRSGSCLAIMQPYFFPYLGYFALLHRADLFILFDTPQYRRRGWMHRNRILSPGGGWQYIRAGIRKPPFEAGINEVLIEPGNLWKEKILHQLAGYRTIAPNYTETVNLIRELLKPEHIGLADLNCFLLQGICDYLGLRCPILRFSKMQLDLNPNSIEHPGHWALKICQAMGARAYINPPNGKEIFRPHEFRTAEVELFFLIHLLPPYDQGCSSTFEAGLSIIDVLMFNSRSTTLEILNKYKLDRATEVSTVRQ